MQTVERAIRLLKEISTEPLRVQEAADKLGIHQSTASRLLSTLQKEYLIRINSNKKYELGYAIYELAHLMRERLDLLDIARPYLEELSNISNETIHLAVLDGYDVVYMDKIDCNRSIRMYSRVGRRAPAYCTGVGKALLAYIPVKDLDLEKIQLRLYTKNTITTLDKLNIELENIRSRGIAWDRGEHEEDIYCIAAPVFDFYNNVIASVSISAMIKYTKPEALAAHSKDLIKAVKELSREMGHVSDG